MRIRLCTPAANSWERLWCLQKYNLYYSAEALTGFVSKWFGSDGGFASVGPWGYVWQFSCLLKRMRKMHSHTWRAQIASEWWAGFGPTSAFQSLILLWSTTGELIQIRQQFRQSFQGDQYSRQTSQRSFTPASSMALIDHSIICLLWGRWDFKCGTKLNEWLCCVFFLFHNFTALHRKK